MTPLVEAVPNISEGRDPALIAELIEIVASRGAEVLDSSSDPDHNRSVLTYVGSPAAVAEASIALAGVVSRRIDLRAHRGVHPRIGALDVLPFVPLRGIDLAGVAALARGVGQALARNGLPVYFYGAAARAGSPLLAERRRGGFESLVGGFAEGREPDLLPDSWPHQGAHPTAGVTCVGARPVLLAWNVYVEGVDMAVIRGLARRIRESEGGFPGLRALAFHLPSRDRMQVSMNLEDLRRTSPQDVFDEIEADVTRHGGAVTETEVIGMIPDDLLLPAAARTLHLLDPDLNRLLSRRVANHRGEGVGHEIAQVIAAAAEAGETVPAALQDAITCLRRAVTVSHWTGSIDEH